MLDPDQKIDNARLYKAFELIGKQEFKSAKDELDQGLKEAQDNKDSNLEALFYSCLGVLYKVKKDFKEAWRYYEKAEKLLPEDPALKLISARLLIDVFGQNDTAVRKCQKVLELCPNDPPFCHQAYVTMGLAQVKQGEKSHAVQSLVKAMGNGFEGLVSASNIDLKLIEAILRKKTGQQEAKQYLESALAFATSTGEENYQQLFTKLLEAFEEETSHEKSL